MPDTAGLLEGCPPISPAPGADPRGRKVHPQIRAKRRTEEGGAPSLSSSLVELGGGGGNEAPSSPLFQRQFCFLGWKLKREKEICANYSNFGGKELGVCHSLFS